MRPRDYDVVIIGSGFAGIVAALKLAEYDIRVLLVDENIRLGGQLLRSPPGNLGANTAHERNRLRKMGFKLIDRIRGKDITLMNQAKVLGIFNEREILVEEHGKRVFTLRPEIILFATGSRERFVPFKGWTLPGVLSTGAVQILMKSSGILPSKEILIGGSGLFLFAVASEFLKNGGRVLSVLEQRSMRDKIPALTQFLGHISKFSEGARYMAKIHLSRVPVRHRTKILEARGKRLLENVVAVRLDRKGHAVEGTEKTYITERLAIGYGFAPNLELPQLAGCALAYERGKGGWVVKVDDGLETTVKNIFAAGEVTGIGGALKSINEGTISAISILHKLGKGAKKESLPRLKKERIQHIRFGHYFNASCRIPDRVITSIPEETVVCRCEDVRMGDIRKAIEEGYDSPLAIKKALRFGMGACQGRTCAPVLYDMLSVYTNRPPGKIPPLSVRPPVKAVAMKSLLN